MRWISRITATNRDLGECSQIRIVTLCHMCPGLPVFGVNIIWSSDYFTHVPLEAIRIVKIPNFLVPINYPAFCIFVYRFVIINSISSAIATIEWSINEVISFNRIAGGGILFIISKRIWKRTFIAMEASHRAVSVRIAITETNDEASTIVRWCLSRGNARIIGRHNRWCRC